VEVLNYLKRILVLISVVFLTSCSYSGHNDNVSHVTPSTGVQFNITHQGNNTGTSIDKDMHIINEDGNIIEERFNPPVGYKRVEVQENSFEEYLRTLPLKSHGAEVMYYDGRKKSREVHEAVVDIDVGDRDLQQCADAVIRLRAEYLYINELFDEIHFNFTNGFNADYSTWMQGDRIKVEGGNNAYWVKSTEYSNDYRSFREYLTMVFAYAGTVSLVQEMQKISVDEMKIGDVFIKGPLPGHCVIVVDMAENTETGEKIFMIAQSYMPAQDIHILKNNDSKSLSPWYSTDFGEKLTTPEWTFEKDQLMRFR